MFGTIHCQPLAEEPCILIREYSGTLLATVSSRPLQCWASIWPSNRHVGTCWPGYRPLTAPTLPPNCMPIVPSTTTYLVQSSFSGLSSDHPQCGITAEA